MTKRERVIKALNHEETDIVPYHVDCTEQALDILKAYTKLEDPLGEYGCHLHYVQYWNYPTELADKPEHYKDGFGVTWNRSGADKDIGLSDTIIDEPDMDLYPIPELPEARIRAEVEELIRTKGDRFTFAGIGFSMFERLWSYCGMENAMVWMITDEEFIDELLDKILEHNLKVIDIYNEYDLDGFYFGDDWGQQKGLIMGPVYWRRFIKPRMAKMYERAKKNGKFILQHSCGDCSEILEDLVEIGLNCYQTFQPEVYDIVSIKETIGNRLAFWGGISTQQSLPYIKPEEVAVEADRVKNVLAKNGGYIWAPTHAIEFDVPAENLVALLEHFRNQ
ncbi:MAG: uroporphyrinogen decarboxylase family protein [Eubacteriales bacterium]